jgi:septal ring factor EnvC (AmiA/AmiB activator)
MPQATSDILRWFIPAMIVIGLLAVLVVATIGAFSHNAKRRRLTQATIARHEELVAATKRSEERTVAYIKSAEEHFDRVEAAMKEIVERLGQAKDGHAS